MYLFKDINSPLCYSLLESYISFEPIVSHFKHILDSFSNCPSGISIRAGAFATGIYDFVTFFVSINASGN